MTEADFHNIDPEKATMGVTVAEYMRLTKEVEYLQARVNQLQTIYEEAEEKVERLQEENDQLRKRIKEGNVAS